MNRPSIRQFTLVFLLALASMSPQAMAVVEIAPDVIPPAVIFVEDAAGGSLTGPDDQHLKLKLKNVRKNIQAIAAGPIPQAVALPNEEFFTAWQQMFPVGPATAFLSYDIPGQQQPRNIVLTLTNPHYDADKRTVTFDAERITPDAIGLNARRVIHHPGINILQPLPLFALTDATLSFFYSGGILSTISPE